MPKKIEKGEVDVDVDKSGIHVHFTNTPKMAYILISIGLMFALIIGAHALYNTGKRTEEVSKLAKKIVADEPLTEDESKLMEGLSDAEMTQLDKDINKNIIEVGGLRVEQRSDTPVTIKTDGDTVEIRKGGNPN